MLLLGVEIKLRVEWRVMHEQDGEKIAAKSFFRHVLEQVEECILNGLLGKSKIVVKPQLGATKANDENVPGKNGNVERDGAIMHQGKVRRHPRLNLRHDGTIVIARYVENSGWIGK